ncbi:3-hydroxyacyl-CoA dehydrogenase NAD-binding domain-containing protein [Salsuginibacillus kocurii]|uniref:3-hydroxyacyl-CoA dehydrogenase NAD-binding domain-containing protein n=1 Tax=Salsuginibacillus kocurii TaxID=427078 RepID=UPI00037E52C6|nr:3-hydroxyacyl-CoA dehydrogenase NAD-binding domain-containing protein [Salsuginibacillus kocurii]
MRNSSSHHIAVIGTGVIGNGWIARCLANGYDVRAFDPAPGAEEKMFENVKRAWPYLEQQMAPEASVNRLTFVDTIEEAVQGASLIQENVPEREPLKRQVLAEIDQAADQEAIIASSTSGLKPSILQADCSHPERVVVAHPFNPVYLLPLVEVVGGEKTSEVSIEAAADFYRSLDMKPLIVRKEIEGHIADRLIEALWRESLHLVNDGIATTEEVDAAFIYGAGMRYALMGPFLTFHLAGGDEGMRHMLQQFGPALELPWTKLQAPELTDELAEQVITGCESQSEGFRISELEDRRDEFLLRLNELLEEFWPGANLNGKL